MSFIAAIQAIDTKNAARTARTAARDQQLADNIRIPAEPGNTAGNRRQTKTGAGTPTPKPRQ